MKNLLAVDIGNTNINLGFFAGGILRKRFIFSSKKSDYRKLLGKIFKSCKIDKVIICSVVPETTRVFEKALLVFLKDKPIILGKNIKVPIINKYDFPRQVGQDRLVNAYAALCLYGHPAIVVDFGTAITFDVVSKKSEYLGGLILPGLGISLEGLTQKTALLPKVKIRPPKGLIGKSTADSMLSGMVYGFALMTDGLINKLRAVLKNQPKIIGTGGNIDFIAKYCHEFKHIDKDLTLKGLNLIYSAI